MADRSLKWAIVAVPAIFSGCLCEPKTESMQPAEPLPAQETVVKSESSQGTGEDMLFKGPGEMLSKEFGEWKINSAPRYFGPDNLYDLINGGAEIFVEFGLKEMVTADFHHPQKSDKTVTVEIYDQGSAIGAFGRVARYLSGLVDPSKSQQGLPASLVGRGMMGSGDLVFWKDRYVVHVTMLDESPTATVESMVEEGKNTLPSFAQAIASKISADSAVPVEFERFPKENRVALSETWEPKQVLSFVELGSGYKARYVDREKRWELFATSEYSSEAEAAAALDRIASLRKDASDGVKRLIAAKKAGNRVIGVAQSTEPFLTDAEKRACLDAIAKGYEGR